MRSLTSWPDWMRQHYLACGMTATLGLCTMVGCGKSSTPVAAVDGDGKSGDSSTKSESPKPKKNTDSDDESAAPTKPGRRMVGDIPLDVFFDNPIAESKQAGEVATAAATPVVAATTPAAATPMPMEEKPADAPAGASAGAGDWASILTTEDIQEEVKKIRLRLQDNLSAIGKYNAHYNKEIRWDGSGLAALAAIAMVHPDKVSWKAHAGQIRDIASEMASKAKGLGVKPFEDTKKEFEKIDGLLGGNPPPDLAPAAENVTFSDVANRRNLMHCLETGADYLRANFQAAATFEKEAEDVARSASIVAAYCKVIGTEGYISADEEDYQNFLKPLLDANLIMAKAAKEKDFTAFSEANGRVVKYCSDCHGTYQSGTN
jgi:hypothetical protein